MGADKRSVSFDPQLAEAIQAAAGQEGQSFSQWLAGAAEMRLRVRDGLEAVAEWEADQGAFTAEELAEADAALDRLLGDRSDRTDPAGTTRAEKAAPPRGKTAAHTTEGSTSRGRRRRAG